VGAFFGPAGVPPIPPPPSGNITFFPASGTITGAVSACILAPGMTSCGVGWPAGVDVFYTLDGSAANEASQWYSCKTNTSGCITLPDPTSSRQVIINAVAVQTANTTLPGCSPTHPCIGVVVVDGHLTPSQGNTNVACSATDPPACPATNFAQSSPPFGTRTSASNPPPVQHGDCETTPSDDLGTRGVVDFDWYYTAQPQPYVDPYVNTNTMVEMDFGTASGKDCGPSTTGTGDTEILVPAIRPTNQLTGSSTTSCDKCTNFAASYYVGGVYEGSPASGTTLNPSYISELEADQNQSNSTFNTATGFGYGTFNERMSIENAAPFTSGGVTSGRWEYSSQNGTNNGWDDFHARYSGVAVISHDAPFPFGVLNAALGTTGCPSNSIFTAGTTIYKGSGGSTFIKSPVLEPGWLTADQGTANAESLLMLGSPGGAITGCWRPSPKSHASGAQVSEMVKVMVHATQYVANASGGTCNVGTANANAMYMDYLSINGRVLWDRRGDGHEHSLTFRPSWAEVSLATPSLNVLNTWATIAVSERSSSVHRLLVLRIRHPRRQVLGPEAALYEAGHWQSLH
jgi:hypothetical protein